jgi:sensor c-di-GMP phosphodiesterase-like protein
VQKAVADRLALEQDLRAALAKGALEVHYQPIVSLGDEGIRGAEALVRWQHPSAARWRRRCSSASPRNSG